MPKYTDALHLRTSLLVVLGHLAAAEGGWCYEDGAPPGHTGGFGEPDCSVCHSDSGKNPPEGSLTVGGSPANAAGRHSLVVVLEHPELRSGGFQLAIRTEDGAPAGELVSVSRRTRVATDGGQSYLQHTAGGREPEAEGRISWELQWVAPENVDTAILHVAANAANDDASALGDYVFTLESDLGRAAGVGEAGEPLHKPGRKDAVHDSCGDSLAPPRSGSQP